MPLLHASSGLADDGEIKREEWVELLIRRYYCPPRKDLTSTTSILRQINEYRIMYATQFKTHYIYELTN